jgi:restriction endonuclease S subunit
MNAEKWLPERVNHPIVALEELCDLCSGITKGRKIDSSVTVEVPYMAVANVQDGSLRLDNVKTIEATPEEIHRYRLLPGDLLLTEGGDPDKLGRGAIWNGEIASCIHQNHIFRARKASQHVDMEYLAHLVSSPYGKRYFLRQSKQTTGIASINMGQLKRFPVPLPPLEEQRRIAAILDKATNIHALAAEKARSSAVALYQSLLKQELDQPGMEWVQLGDVLEIARGGSPRPIQSYLTDDPDGINWIMIGDAGVGEKYIASTAKKIRAEGLSKTRVVKEGDLLLSNSMSFGRPYIMKTNGAIHDGWLVLRDAHAMCSSDYLYHVLGSPMCYAQFARAAAGATVKNLNTSIVSSVEIPLTSLERQVEIAKRLDAVELHFGRKFALLANVADQLGSSLASSLIQVAI